MKTFKEYHSVESKNPFRIIFYQREDNDLDNKLFGLYQKDSMDSTIEIMRAAAKNIIDELNKEEPCHDIMEAR